MKCTLSCQFSSLRKPSCATVLTGLPAAPPALSNPSSTSSWNDLSGMQVPSRPGLLQAPLRLPAAVRGASTFCSRPASTASVSLHPPQPLAPRVVSAWVTRILPPHHLHVLPPYIMLNTFTMWPKHPSSRKPPPQGHSAR